MRLCAVFEAMALGCFLFQDVGFCCDLGCAQETNKRHQDHVASYLILTLEGIESPRPFLLSMHLKVATAREDMTWRSRSLIN